MREEVEVKADNPTREGEGETVGETVGEVVAEAEVRQISEGALELKKNYKKKDEKENIKKKRGREGGQGRGGGGEGGESKIPFYFRNMMAVIVHNKPTKKSLEEFSFFVDFFFCFYFLSIVLLWSLVSPPFL